MVLMDNFLIYGPCALFVITTLISVKIFARSEDLLKLKAELLEYMNNNFVKESIYADNHKALQQDIAQMRQDVSDVKNLLIGIINGHNQRN